MPNQRLTWVLDVNASGAVSTLNAVGTAGQKAAGDIEQGFTDAGSASQRALDALTTTLDDMATEAAATKKAVAAIGEHLTIDVDESTITRFTQDLKSKFGLAFDQIEGDAKAFADVLERGVDMSKTTTEIRGVGDALDTTRGEADQSRSVLANLAGNSAQSLGELGGVVGDLGVGIGQLAEYAVDGNIKLSNLAAVAGPMAALAAASMLVSEGMKGVSEIRAFDAERAERFTDAIREGGSAVASLRDDVAETGELLTVTNGAFGSFGGAVKDILPLLKQYGISFSDFQTLLTDDAALNALVEYRDGLDGAQDAVERSDYLKIINGVSDYRTAINGVAADQAALNDWLEVTPSTLDDANAAYKKSLDPLNEASGAWEELTNWVKSGEPATEAAASSMEHLTETTGKLPAEILAVVDANLAAELDAQTAAADGTAEKYAELRQQSADLAQTTADLAATMSSADFNAAGIAAAGDALAQWFNTTAAGGTAESALFAYQDALDAFAANLVENEGIVQGALSGMFTVKGPEAREQLGMLERLGETVMPQITQAFEDSGGSFDKFNRSVSAISDSIHRDLVAALIESGVEAGDAEDQANSLQMALGLIPDNVATMFELQGDAAARAKLDLLLQDLEGLPPEVISEVRANILADDPQAALNAIQSYLNTHRTTATMGLDTAPAFNDYYAFHNVADDPIRVPVYFDARNTFRVPGGGYVASPYAAPAPPTPAMLGAAPAPAAATVAPAPVVVGAAARPIVVNLNAGMIGGRYEVQRGVTAALLDAQRLGRI